MKKLFFLAIAAAFVSGCLPDGQGEAGAHCYEISRGDAPYLMILVDKCAGRTWLAQREKLEGITSADDQKQPVYEWKWFKMEKSEYTNSVK